MMNEAPVPHRGADRPCLPRLLFADVFCRAIKAAPLIRPPKAEELEHSMKLSFTRKKAGSMILPCLCNACRLFADPDMLCQCLELQESAYGTDIPLLKLWKLLKLLQSGEKCTAVHGFSLHLFRLSANLVLIRLPAPSLSSSTEVRYRLRASTSDRPDPFSR